MADMPFRSASEYLEAYDAVFTCQTIYTFSHVIFQMLLSGVSFSAKASDKYEDWGTIESWNRYKSQFATLFVDIDGVIF